MKHAYTGRSNANSKAQANNETCTHPGTISATQTCNAAIHGPWTHLMIANQIQINQKHHNNHRHKINKNGFYWKVWENKWVFNCDLNEEYVCV